MRQSFRDIKWNVIGPLGLLALALLLVGWFSLTSDGDAEPAPPLGRIGTPVRGTFVPPTATPVGVRTPRPTPRAPIQGAAGTPAERDAKRRSDLLILVDAFERLKAREGEYPSTGGNVQTLCAFEDLDEGCALKEILGPTLPVDPLGAQTQNGYWYSSDGDIFMVYASLEEEVPAEQLCDTDDANLQDKANLICVEFP